MIKTSEHKKTTCCLRDAKGHNIHKKILSIFMPKDGWLDGN
jgi:hypothetical protein